MSAERKMMLGSEQKLDYLILKEREYTAVGVKPLVALSMKYGILLMVRLRASWLPSAPQPEKVKGAVFDKTWPEVMWDKVDATRASSLICVPLGLQPWQHKEAAIRAPYAAETLSDFLCERLGELDHDRQDAIAFIVKGWVEEMQSLAAGFPEAPEVTPEGAMADYFVELFPDAKSEPPSAKEVAKDGQKLFQSIDGGKSDGPHGKKAKGSHLKLVPLEDDEQIDLGDDDDGVAGDGDEPEDFDSAS